MSRYPTPSARHPAGELDLAGEDLVVRDHDAHGISGGSVEVLEARSDKPISTLRTTIINQDGTVVLDGRARVWSERV